MPYVMMTLAPQGCLLDLTVGVSIPRQEALRKAGLPIPPAVAVRALIDTGASSTLICSSVLEPLKLAPTGQVPIHTPSTDGEPVTAPQYDVFLGIYHARGALTLGIAPVLSMNMSGNAAQALLGRDVLSQCLLVYDGVSGTFTLAF